MDAIRTSGLTKAYGAKRAVDGVSLTVGAGEIYGFVGRNGADPSTAAPAPDAAAWSQAAGAEPPRGYDGRGGGRDA